MTPSASGDSEAVEYTELATDPRLMTITVVSFVAVFGTYAASPALPSIVSEVGVSDSDVGLVMSAYALPAVFLLPVFGVVMDMYGRRTVLLPSLVVFCGAGISIAFVDSFAMILVLRTIQGIGGAALIPVAITLIGDYYSGATGSAAQGIRLSANGLSSIILPVIAGFLAGIAWHVPFLLYGMAIPAFVLAYVYVPEPLAQSDQTSIRDEINEYINAIRAEITDIDMTILLSAGFFQGFSYYTILTFVPLFAVTELRTSVFLAGAVLSMRGIARIIISPATGLILTKVTRKRLIAGSLVVSAIATGFIGLSPSILWLAMFLGMWGIGDALFTPVHRDALTTVASDNRRGGVVSCMLILYRVGTTISPAFFGIVLVFAGYAPIFYIAAGVYIVLAVLFVVYFNSG